MKYLLTICLLLLLSLTSCFCLEPRPWAFGGEQLFLQVRLVVGYDQSVDSKQMFPILAGLRAAGYDIVYTDLTSTNSQKYREAFELDKDSQLPCYLMYIGHEAFEKRQGVLTEKELKDWFAQVNKGLATAGVAKPVQQKLYLQNDPLNLIYLRKTLSPPSCGMLWCVSHRYEILQWVDANGKVIGPAKP